MGWTTEVAADGHLVATVELQLIIPAVSMIEYTRVRYRRNGTPTYAAAQLVYGTGTKLVKIGGLVPGLSYDFEAATVSGPNESTPSTITNVLAPGDTVAPLAPAGLTKLGDGKLSSITFFWEKPTNKELSQIAQYDYDIRTAASGGGSLVLGSNGANYGPKANQFTLEASASIGYGVTRHFRVRARDNSKNVGAWSSSVSFTFARTATDDYGDNTLATIKIIDAAISTGKIAINAVSQHLDSGISGLVGLTGAFATIRSLIVTSLGGLLRVDGNCTLGCTSKDGTIGSLEYHLRNLTTGAVSPLARWQLGPAINDFYLSLDSNLQETPGAGTFTYVLEARFASGNFVGPFANQGRIRLSEFKK